MDRGWMILLGSLALLGAMIGPAYADGAFSQEPVALEPARAEIVAETNALRTSHDLGALERDDQLDAAATAHAEDMADRGELFHSETRERAQYQCEGGEVTAYTYIRERIQHHYGEVYVTNGTELGVALFKQWHHSVRHNDILVAYDADRIGVGLTKTENGTVYSAVWVC
jgi:uncharacterized protein YkwD